MFDLYNVFTSCTVQFIKVNTTYLISGVFTYLYLGPQSFNSLDIYPPQSTNKRSNKYRS